jgi:hypothetical protein
MKIEKRITWTYDETEIMKQEAMKAAFERQFGGLQPGEEYSVYISSYSDCYIKTVPVEKEEPVKVDEP